MPTPLDQFPAQTQKPAEKTQDALPQTRDTRDSSRHSPDTGSFRDDVEPETGDQSGTPPQDADNGQMVPIAALKEERAKRQEYETRFNELNERLSRVEQPQPQNQVADLPDPIDDPDGFKQAVVATVRSEQLAMSVEMVREVHQDYDQAEVAFVEAAKADPQLQAKFRASRHPGKFIYDHGKKFLSAKQIQEDPEAYRKRIKDEILAELRGEAPNGEFREQSQDRQQQSQPQERRFPSSIASSRAVAPRSNPGFSGPTPLAAFPGPAPRRA